MPWKIKKTSDLTDKNDPRIHMFDGTVNVNMLTHLDSGIVDLWVGHDQPDLAGIYITIDSERDPILRVEPTAGSPRGLDLAVMTTVLEALGVNPNPLLGRFKRFKPTQGSQYCDYKNSRRANRDQGATTQARSPNHEAKPRT